MFQILVYLFCENCNPPLKKVTPSFPATPYSKLRSCQAPPLWKFGRRFKPPPPPQQKGGEGGCTLCYTGNRHSSTTLFLLWKFLVMKNLLLLWVLFATLTSTKCYCINSKTHWPWILSVKKMNTANIVRVFLRRVKTSVINSEECPCKYFNTFIMR